jgi:prepilin peptidase CpaA
METFLIIFLASVLSAAVFTDLRFQKIPNYLTFSTVIIALAYHGVAKGLDGLLFSAGGLAVGMSLFILPYAKGGMGAGDVKLMGAVGAILGAKGALIAALYTALFGGIYALILFVIRHKECASLIARYATMLKVFAVTRHFIFISADEGENAPRLFYGVAIALGTLFSVYLELSGYKFPI